MARLTRTATGPRSTSRAITLPSAALVERRPTLDALTGRPLSKKKTSSALSPEVIAYAKQGFKFFPVEARGKKPLVKWKSAATCDLGQIEAWTRQFSGCNWGWAIPDDFIVIDADDKLALRALEAKGLRLPDTLTIETSRGAHRVFKGAPGIKNSVGELGPKLDVRAAGGYIVFAGSTHETGKRYTIVNDVPVADAPQWLIGTLTCKAKAAAPQSASGKGKMHEGSGRNNVFTSLAGVMRRAGFSEDAIRAALGAENPHRNADLLPKKEIDSIARSIGKKAPGAVAALLNDERPRVLLSSDNRLVSEVAYELAPHLRGELYVYNGNIAAVESAKIRTIGAQEFRTLVERRVICCRIRTTRGAGAEVGVTMSVEEARALLASPQLRAALLPLKRVASCRVPAKRAGGSIELLPPGYDAETATLTVCEVEYRDDMSHIEAVSVIRDLFEEFRFVAPRDFAVAVAALIGLYAQPILSARSLRPLFLYTKNGEGAGATTCAACAIVSVTGTLPTSTAPGDGEEMRKLLTTSLREGRTVVLLDNCKRTIGGEALEAFTSAPTWRDRLLGVNETGEYENNATVFATGNGATCTPDIRRRKLQCELELWEERAEDRVYKRPLNVAALCAMRPQILAACWSLVRHWDDAGRPGPSRSHSAFPEWATVIGGIVQHAGFGCPLDTPASSVVLDEDGEAMRELVDAMSTQPGERFTAKRIFAMCRVREVFLQFVGRSDLEMKHVELAKIGKILARYNNRMVGEWRFVIEGKGHAKRFYVDAVGSPDLHGRMVAHGISPVKQNDDFSSLRGTPCAIVQPCKRRRRPPVEAAPKYTLEGRAARARKDAR